MKVVLLGSLASGKTEILEQIGLPAKYHLISNLNQELSCTILAENNFWWQYYFLQSQIKKECEVSTGCFLTDSGLLNILAYSQVILATKSCSLFLRQLAEEYLKNNDYQYFYCQALPDKYRFLSPREQQLRYEVEECLQGLVEYYGLNYLKLSGDIDDRLGVIFNYLD